MSFVNETFSNEYQPCLRPCTNTNRDLHISKKFIDDGSNFVFQLLGKPARTIDDLESHSASCNPAAAVSVCSTTRNEKLVCSFVDSTTGVSGNEQSVYSTVELPQRPQTQARQSLGKIDNSKSALATIQTSSSAICSNNDQSSQSSSVNNPSTHSLTACDVPRLNLLDYVLSSTSAVRLSTFGVQSQSHMKRKQSIEPSKPHESNNSKNPSTVSSSSINDPSSFTRPIHQSSSTRNTSPMAKQSITEPSKPLESTIKSYPVGPSEFQLTLSLSRDPWDVTTQNADWMYIDKTGLKLALNLNTSLLLEHLYNTCSQFNSTVRMRLPETGREYEICLREMEMTDVHTGEKTALLRKTWTPDIPQPLETDASLFPLFWSPQKHDIVLITLDKRTDEYHRIRNTFLHTMPECCVVGIERIQNKKLFIRYSFQKTVLLDKNYGGVESINEKLLFHGTSRTPPRKIWQSEDGFDLRYSRRGMWGIGSYFAENASYSDQYAYKNTGNYHVNFREIMIGNVLTGNSKEMPSNGKSRHLTRPPVYVEATASNPEVLYDSVTGFAGGSRIYVLYKLDMAYPSYLIRYFKLDR